MASHTPKISGMFSISGHVHNIHDLLYSFNRSNVRRDTRVQSFIKKYNDSETALDVLTELLMIAHKVGLIEQTYTDWQNPIIIGDPLDLHYQSTHVKRLGKSSKKPDKQPKQKPVANRGFRAKPGETTERSDGFYERFIKPSRYGNKSKRVRSRVGCTKIHGGK